MAASHGDKLARLWDADILGLIVIGLSGAVLEANDRFLQIVGYTRAEFDAAPFGWERLSPPEVAATGTMLSQQLVRDGMIAAGEVELVHHDGHRVPVLLGSALLDGAGAPQCLAFVHDLTKTKQLETQLLQAQRLESVGLLAGGIAHDLNNVLSVILLNAECAQMQLRSDDPVRGELEEIRLAANSARSITQQLLAFSRQQVLQPQLIELGGVCLGMEKMLRRLIGDDIQLIVQAAASRQVMADLGQLEQVVLNLVVNARDAMPRGGVLAIHVADLQIPPDVPANALPTGAYVHLRVRDEGSGMDAATLSRIFEPFFTTKAKARGTGLGLSTVFGIVQQSGGTVWAESTVGSGSTFHVVLPMASGLPPRIRRRSEFLPSQGGHETILVVDDEQAICRSLRRVLERAGYHVLVASSPGDALLIAEHEGAKIELLLSDVVMSLMSGPELVARLRRMLPRLRALLMTGYVDRATVDSDVLPDLSVVLSKPFSSAEVLLRVREALDAAE